MHEARLLEKLRAIEALFAGARDRGRTATPRRTRANASNRGSPRSTPRIHPSSTSSSWATDGRASSSSRCAVDTRSMRFEDLDGRSQFERDEIGLCADVVDDAHQVRVRSRIRARTSADDDCVEDSAAKRAFSRAVAGTSSPGALPSAARTGSSSGSITTRTRFPSSAGSVRSSSMMAPRTRPATAEP